MRLSFRYNSLEELGFALFSDPKPYSYIYEGWKKGVERGRGCRWEEEKGGMEWGEGEGKEGRFSQNLSGNKKGRLCY